MEHQISASVLAAGSLALAFAACGGREPAASPRPSQAASAAPAPAAAIDACKLLEKQEVDAALGKPVGAPAPENMPPVYGCRWRIEVLDGLGLSVIAYDSPAQALAAHEMAIKINNYEQVAGVGERAYTSPFNEVTALAGRYELSVDVTLSQADRPAIAKALALKALARLPR
jgi:hypothetical protein